MMGVRIGAVDLVNLPVGPDETLACVQFGLFLIEERGTRFVTLMRGPNEQNPQQGVTLEVLCADREKARTLLHDLRELMVALNVFRNQVISFGESQMGHYGICRSSSITGPTCRGANSSWPRVYSRPWR